ncbi:MAG TPA: hypothetical protein VJH23_05670 [archaeon]|nr:hypothetical protein [archaeon]
MVNFLHGEELVPGYEPGMNQSKAGGRLKAKTLNSLSGLSAFLSTIGSSWSVCHSICLALITVLAGIGIVLTGMPLLFLFEYNLYLWGAAVLLLIPSAIMFLQNPGCISKNLMLFNFGVIIAGIPTNLVNLQPFSWIAGGTLVLAALMMFIKSKLAKKEERK